MKLNGLVPFDREFVVMNRDCLLINRGVQIIPRMLQQIPVQSTQRVRENRTHLGKVYWSNLSFFKKLGTVDDQDTAQVEFPRARDTRQVGLE